MNIPYSWNELLEKTSPLIFGILNVTPDSFSDGGQFLDKDAIRSKIEKLIEEGAHVIDVGAESTRPNAKEVSDTDQLERLSAVFEIVKDEDFGETLFSIDTRNSEVARTAIENGFQIINDVSGGLFDSQTPGVIDETKALVILTHSRGTPETMMGLTDYIDVTKDVCSELSSMVRNLESAGVQLNRIMVDPGIGFAKTPEQGLELLDNLALMKDELGLPIMVGISRKTIVSYLMTGDPSSVPFEDRDDLSADMCKSLVERGADALRVHDVEKTISSLRSA